MGVVLSEGGAAWRALGSVVYEQAASFYAEDARRVLQAHADRRTPPPEANARTAFKVTMEDGRSPKIHPPNDMTLDLRLGIREGHQNTTGSPELERVTRIAIRCDEYESMAMPAFGPATTANKRGRHAVAMSAACSSAGPMMVMRATRRRRLTAPRFQPGRRSEAVPISSQRS